MSINFKQSDANRRVPQGDTNKIQPSVWGLVFVLKNIIQTIIKGTILCVAIYKHYFHGGLLSYCIMFDVSLGTHKVYYLLIISD